MQHGPSEARSQPVWHPGRPSDPNADAAARVKATREAADWFDLMVHKLSQPFTSMRCGLDLAALRPDQGWPEKVSKELDRAVSIMHGFQALMRADLCGEHCEPTDIAAIVAGCVDELLPRAEEAGVGLNVMLRDKAAVIASPVHLRESVWNVLVDCILSTPAGGRVTVTARTKNEMVEVEFMDGALKAPSALEYLTEAFPPARRANQGIPRGGFGLALAERSLRAMGGGLQIAREENGNLRFVMSLRRATDEGAA